MGSKFVFDPDGNDLKKVLYFFGVDLDEKIICPFHDDNRPSCVVDLEEGRFHCFACQASGNAYDFVKLSQQHIDDELELLMAYFKILGSKKVKKLNIPNVNKRYTKKHKAKNKSTKLQYLNEAEDYFNGLKKVNWFKVKSPYKYYMLKRGFNSQILNKCGVKLTITNNAYPLVFPILDQGEFKGYVCRTTDPIVEKKRKYLYNKGFSRVDTLGGNYKAKTVVLCEGYMDMLKMKQFGLENVAAIFGWKITRDQVDKLKNAGVETIISALDLDGPGREGTDYLRNFFNVIEFQFPKFKIVDGKRISIKDPGDLDKDLFKKAYHKTKQLL